MRLERADREAVALLEQPVELRAVGVEGALDVEQGLEQLLDVGDVLADADLPAADV
jgi:hypothetical protein